MPSEPTRLLLIRHGETEANVADRWQGWSDAPLTQRGWRQIRRVAEALADKPLSVIYSSPLGRAKQTAQAIAEAHNLPVRVHDALKEYHVGDLEGMPNTEVQRQYGELIDRLVDDPDVRIPGGESIREFHDRISQAIDEIRNSHVGETVAVVAHGGVIAVTLSHWFASHPTGWMVYDVDNASISEVEIASEPHLVRLNDVNHLPSE